MLFSDLQKVLHPLMPSILNHPFNHGIANGILPTRLFNTFLQNDKEYLGKFSETLSIIADRLQTNHPTHAKQFYYFSVEARDTEKHLHRKYLKKNHPSCFFKSPSLKENLAVTAYIKHLSEAAKAQSISVAIAASLPCLCIYRELGVTMPRTSNHRFSRWIATYSSPQFLQMAEDMIAIFNEHSHDIQCDLHRRRIMDSFITSVQHEINFWDSVYANKVNNASSCSPDALHFPKKPC